MMNKRLCAFALLGVLLVSLSLPCFGASVAVTGTGSKADPYRCYNSDTVYYTDVVSFPFYVHATGSRGNIYCRNVVFESGETYYAYFPNVDSHSTRLYTYSSATSPGNIVLQTFTLEYESENWLVYSFTASQDGFGCQTRYSGTNSTFYYDTSLHEPYEYGKVAETFFGTCLNVGSSLMSFVIGTPLILMSFTVFVFILGVGLILRLIKGV